ENRSASRARISNVMRSRRSKKSSRRQLATLTRRITPKATNPGTSFTGFRFTARRKAKKTGQHKAALVQKSEATIRCKVLVAGRNRDAARVGADRGHPNHSFVASQSCRSHNHLSNEHRHAEILQFAHRSS